MKITITIVSLSWLRPLSYRNQFIENQFIGFYMVTASVMKGLSNPFFNSFMKMKNKKWSAFRFPFILWKWKMNGVLKIQRKTLLSMKMVAKYLNFVFHIEAKTKSNYAILNFVFQSMKNTKCHFRYTDFFFFTSDFHIFFRFYILLFHLEHNWILR